MVKAVIPKPIQKNLGARVRAAHHESTACDVGGSQFGDAACQGVETPGIHAVCQHFTSVVSMTVAGALACLPCANHQRVICFFKAQALLVFFGLRLKPQELAYLITQPAHAATAWHSTLSVLHLPLTGHTSPSSGQITLAASVRPKYAKTSAGVPFQRS